MPARTITNGFGTVRTGPITSVAVTCSTDIVLTQNFDGVVDPALPAGWCGKQHACHALAQHAAGDFVLFLDADVRLAPDATHVTALLTIERREGVAASAPLVLDGDGLTLLGVAIDGQALSTSDYEATPDRLTILKPPAAQRFELRLETEIAPSRNEALMGLYRSNNVYCTQCEAEGFRRITYFLDRPDILSVYTVRIEAPHNEALLLLSNGNPVERGALANGRHYAIWHDPFPKPSYLFALVAGALGKVAGSFTTMSGREVELGIYVEPGKERLAGYAMDALKRSMKWDEDAFGREYDLDVFNIVVF